MCNVQKKQAAYPGCSSEYTTALSTWVVPVVVPEKTYCLPYQEFCGGTIVVSLLLQLKACTNCTCCFVIIAQIVGWCQTGVVLVRTRTNSESIIP